ncbi:hypothetical protein EON81_29385 [bacterium]|nr:MAG: hypothetical protein EON81_29385 [bacterium]
MKSLATLLLVLVALIGAAGCSSEDTSAGNGVWTPPADAEADRKAKIAAIDANPNMPPQAKEIAKAQLMRNGTGQKTQNGK